MSNHSELTFEGDSSIYQAFKLTKEWFEERKAQLQLVVDHSGVPINLQSESDGITELTGRDAALFRAGVQIALFTLGEFPLTISVNDPAEDIQD